MIYRTKDHWHGVKEILDSESVEGVTAYMSYCESNDYYLGDNAPKSTDVVCPDCKAVMTTLGIPH